MGDGDNLVYGDAQLVFCLSNFERDRRVECGLQLVKTRGTCVETREKRGGDSVLVSRI